MGAIPKEGWKRYLEFLDSSEYSIGMMTSSLAPEECIASPQIVSIGALNYKLFPFQEGILKKIGEGDALVVGLPTGLGKTYLAGAFIARECSMRSRCRVLFLTPSVPLGVQQTLFARRMLGLSNAFFISGNIPPERRKELNVWNAGFAVTTPQTFYNDILHGIKREIEAAKTDDEPVYRLAVELQERCFKFPYTIVVADECHGYIGETDGYSILLAAKASGSQILALSATPQLHAPNRLNELKKIFGKIEVFSVEEPVIKEYMPERLIALVPVAAPAKLLAVYYQLDGVIRTYQDRIRKAYGAQHLRGYCRNKRHALCVCLLALRMMKFRMVEDGASSVANYGIWKMRELNSTLEGLGWRSIYETYKESMRRGNNHKIDAALRIIDGQRFEKAIAFVESVEAAKQMGLMLQKKRGTEDVAVLVGKGGMKMEQQASSLMQFRQRARILVCTSIGEEGLDVPSADLEIWLDPPSNPKKWIQRFGRILRQSGEKRVAKTYSLITLKTHERNKLLGVKSKVEKVYRFTQRLSEEKLPEHIADQRDLSQFFREEKYGVDEGS